HRHGLARAGRGGPAVTAILTENDGADVVSSSYWGSECDRAGEAYCSVSAGCVRVLLPTGSGLAKELPGAQYAILSRGPWPDAGLAEGVEVLFEDHSNNPFVLHLPATSFDVLPGEPAAGQRRRGAWGPGPPRAAPLPCHWRRVPRIPWLQLLR